MRPVCVLALTSVLLLFAGGCGSASPDSGETDLASRRTRSPLEDALGLQIEGDVAQAAQAVSVQNREYEISRCMAARGFEYAPDLGHAESLLNATVGEGLAELEFAERYGLGIVPIYLESVAAAPPDPNAVGFEPNPNDRILQSLGESERIAWYVALWGPDGGPLRFEGADEFDAGETPCADLASQRNEDARKLVERIAVSLAEVEAEALKSDQRIVEANLEWSRCMADEGYQYEDPMTMRAEFLTAVSERLAVGSQATSPQERARTETAALDGLASIEINVALANLQCSSALEAVTEVVLAEVEATYVESNADLLAETRVALNEG